MTGEECSCVNSAAGWLIEVGSTYLDFISSIDRSVCEGLTADFGSVDEGECAGLVYDMESGVETDSSLSPLCGV